MGIVTTLEEREKEFYFLPSPYRLSKRENIKRHAWFFVQKYIVSTSPKCFSRWRIFWLRLFGARIGRGCYVAASAYIHLPWKLTMGNNVTIDERCYLQGDICMGAYVAVGNNVHMVSEGHNVRSRYFEGVSKPIVIGNGAFIGGDVYIARGVRIGQFTVVGAKSVVWHNLPENVIAFGNPCEIKSERIGISEYRRFRYE